MGREARLRCFSSRPASLSVAAGHQVVVDHGVVGPVNEQRLAVDPEPRRGRHAGAQHLDVVAAVDLDGRPVLGADHDGLGGTVPVARKVVAEVVQPRRARLRVGEPELGRKLRGDVHEPVLCQNQRRTDVLDVAVGEADQQHLRVVVAAAVAVGGVELRVTSDVETRPLDLVHRLAVLVVRGQCGREAVERLVERVAGAAEQITPRQGHDSCEDNRDRQTNTGLLTVHLSPQIVVVAWPVFIILYLLNYVKYFCSKRQIYSIFT